MRIGIYRGNLVASPGDKLIGNASCTCKQIKDTKGFKIDKVVQDIKQTFFCKVGCWTHRKTGRRMNLLTPEFSADDPHWPELKRE